MTIFRIKGRRLYFSQFQFFCEGAPSQYKKIIEPPKNRAGYIVQWILRSGLIMQRMLSS